MPQQLLGFYVIVLLQQPLCEINLSFTKALGIAHCKHCQGLELVVEQANLSFSGFLESGNRNSLLRMKNAKERDQKKNYKNLDICPNYVYPTYLVA